MPQVSNSEDVYRQLVEESEDDWLFALVTFAVFEEQRIEWMKHQQQTNGAAPTNDQICEWYRQQPAGVFMRAKGTAENALQLYADDVLQEVLAVERREVADGVIVSEIRSTHRFLPQFGINVAGGFTSAIIFAAILALLAFIIFSDASPVKLTKDAIDYQSKESVDGNSEAQQRSNE